MNPRKIGADGAGGHGLVDGLLRGDEGVRGAVVAVDAIHHPAVAFGNAAASRQSAVFGKGAVGILPLDPGNRGARGVGGNVLDVAEVNAVNSRVARERVDTAQMQNEDGLRFGVRGVVSKVRFDQQLVAVEARGSVAAFAGVARGAQTADRRGNRRGIVGNDFWRKRRKRMERDFNELLGAVDLGIDVGLSAGSDVAIDAGHVGVRRDLVGRKLRLHHMAGTAAELRRIHVLRAVIAGRGDDEKIDDGENENDVEPVTEVAVVEIDAGKRGGNLAGFLQLSAPQTECRWE